LIPPYPGTRLLGSLAEFRRDRLAFLRRVADTMGPIAEIRLGPRRLVLINSPELVRTVFVDRGHDFLVGPPNRGFFDVIWGRSLLNLAGDPHKRQRRLLAPHFQPRAVASLAKVAAEKAEELVRRWRAGEGVDLVAESSRLSLEIMVSTFCRGADAGLARRLGEAVLSVNAYQTHVMGTVLPLPLSVPTARNRRARRALAEVERLSSELMSAAPRDLGGDDVRSMLWQAAGERDGLDAGELRDSAKSYFYAGHDTLKNALVWSLLLLLQHPEALEKVRAEAVAVPDPTDQDQLPYTLGALKEALRLYTPDMVLYRTALREVPLGAHAVATGQQVLAAPWVLHRTPAFFPDPDRYDPERFSPGREREITRYAYLPFGIGPHTCLGIHLATQAGVAALAVVARRARLSLLPGREVKPAIGLGLAPSGPVPARVEALT